jgi:hypothetical protein
MFDEWPNATTDMAILPAPADPLAQRKDLYLAGCCEVQALIE